MRIAILCHYFPPEVGAPAARIYEMAKCWVEQGHDVQVVTCFPNHPTGVIPERYRGMRYHREVMDGIKVHRCWVYAAPSGGFVKRTIGHLSFMISSILYGMRRLGSIDIVITSSPSFFSIFAGDYISHRKRVPFVLEIRDLWPAAIVELGLLRNRYIIRMLERMELYEYRRATRLVMVTNSFKQNLIDRGISGGKIDVITNGYDGSVFFPRNKNSDLAAEYDLEGRFVVAYVGTHGISQALHTVILAAERLRDDDEIRFLLVGEGADKENLMNLAREKHLSNVLFVDSQPKHTVPEFYSIADLCLVPLKKVPLFSTFIPSKMFEIMGCGIPILASLEGESAAILKASKAASVIPPEDVDALVAEVVRLKNNPILLEEMRHNGPGFVKSLYSREALARKYIETLNKATEEYSK